MRSRRAILPTIGGNRGGRFSLCESFALQGSIAACLALLGACGVPVEESATTRPAEHREVAWRDLAGELAFAEVDREIDRIELGARSARRYLREGWGVDEADDSRGFVWGIGTRSTVDFFVTDPRPLELGFQCRALAADVSRPQVLSVSLNGERLRDFELEVDFQKYHVAVPANIVRLGSNVLALEYSRNDAPRELVPGSKDERKLAVQWYSIRIDGLHDSNPPFADVESLVLPVGSSATFAYLLPKETSFLVLDRVATVGASRLAVEVTAAGSSLTLVGVGSGSQQRIELPRSDQPVRLRLIAQRSGGFGALIDPASWKGGSRVEIGTARIVHEPSPAAPELAADSTKVRIPTPNILIYLIDTLRADRLGVYGHARATSPRIDRFANDAVVFMNAQAQASWTRAAVASVFTGQLPRVHGVERREDGLGAESPVLADLLSGLGYRSHGFITNGNVSAEFGLDRGFSTYRYLNESHENRGFHRLADELNKSTLASLEKLAVDGDPTFFYLHASDPHAPYTPEDSFAARLAPGVDPEVGRLDRVLDISAGRTAAGDGTAENFSSLYDAEIAFVDHHFGRLLDNLRKLDLYDDMLIVVTSDHGEEFDDHGGWEHGKTLFAEQLHIPLLIKFPAQEHAGARIRSLARQIDILPTLFDYVGGSVPPTIDGASLLPILESDSGSPFGSPAFLELGERRISSLQQNGWKLIVDRSGFRRGSEIQLYEVAADPGELVDLFRERPVIASWLHQSLRRLEARAKAANDDAAVDVEMSQDVRDRLEALGYL